MSGPVVYASAPLTSAVVAAPASVWTLTCPRSKPNLGSKAVRVCRSSGRPWSRAPGDRISRDDAVVQVWSCMLKTHPYAPGESGTANDVSSGLTLLPVTSASGA